MALTKYGFFFGGGGTTTEDMTSRICRMRDPRTPAPTFMVALWPDFAAVSVCSSCSIGWISLQNTSTLSLGSGQRIFHHTFLPPCSFCHNK